MADWTRVACEVADAIRSAECVTPTASKTDLGGTYGTPEIVTLLVLGACIGICGSLVSMTWWLTRDGGIWR